MVNRETECVALEDKYGERSSTKQVYTNVSLKKYFPISEKSCPKLFLHDLKLIAKGHLEIQSSLIVSN